MCFSDHFILSHQQRLIQSGHTNNCSKTEWASQVSKPAHNTTQIDHIYFKAAWCIPLVRLTIISFKVDLIKSLLCPQGTPAPTFLRVKARMMTKSCKVLQGLRSTPAVVILPCLLSPPHPYNVFKPSNPTLEVFTHYSVCLVSSSTKYPCGSLPDHPQAFSHTLSFQKSFLDCVGNKCIQTPTQTLSTSHPFLPPWFLST